MVYLHLASWLLLFFCSSHCNCCKVLDDTLGVDGLSSTRFSTRWNNVSYDQYDPHKKHKTCRCTKCGTYVIRTDWFSLSERSEYSPWVCNILRGLHSHILCNNWYLEAWTDRRCQRWRRCEAELQSSSCLCILKQPPNRTLGATCRGWQWRRTAQSMSVDGDRTVSNTSDSGVMRRSGQTHIDHPCCITLFEVIQHSGLAEVGHHGHVFHLVKLGRVHGEDFILFHSEGLSEGRDTSTDSSAVISLIWFTKSLIFSHLVTQRLHGGFATFFLDEFPFEVHLLRFSYKIRSLGVKGGVLRFNPLSLWLAEVNGRRAKTLHFWVPHGCAITHLNNAIKYLVQGESSKSIPASLFLTSSCSQVIQCFTETTEGKKQIQFSVKLYSSS